MSKEGEAKKKIIFLYCGPCHDYHLRTHPHCRAMKRQSIKRRREEAPKISLVSH